MWEQYRKTAPFMQVFIIAACITVYFMTAKQWLPVLMLLLVMELGALGGAWWGARMRRRMQQSRDELPLKPRR